MLHDLRRRIGATPLKHLFEVLAGPLAQPSTPGVCYRRWRTVAFDGCRSLAAPDHERNRAWLGRFTHRFGLEAEVQAHTADGGRSTGSYRLLTTLTDHRADPAEHLVHLYHERWEVESSFLALRHTLPRGRVLRSKDRPAWSRNCGGSWFALPGPALGDGHGRGDRRWLRPGPGRLHHGPGGSP
ncbi:hypothetical protein [Streptomyces sp. NPDC059003]|uniref:hypothetical protein n=1 Tax=Streptomyces sp. NPDC059003 TaxID=3346691 RepID=UPI0036CCFC5D